jgi:hypothetical protein
MFSDAGETFLLYASKQNSTSLRLRSRAITILSAVRAIAAARGDCHNDVEEMNEWQWQCSDNLFSVIAQMYAVIVGDVKLEAFQSSGAMEAMFVLFTFISIIILLK